MDLDSIDPLAAAARSSRAAPAAPAAPTATASEHAVLELPPVDGVRRPAIVRAAMPSAQLGLPWVPGGLPPVQRTTPLRRWHPEIPARQPPIPPPPKQPRLAVGAMVRAAPVVAVDGFLRYYHAIGFEQVFLFFDAPTEDEKAIAAAEAHAAAVGGVSIHRCDASWWAEERESGRSFQRMREYQRSQEQRRRDGSNSSDGPAGLDYKLCAPWEVSTVELATMTPDVQAKQSLVMNRALREAFEMGLDWMLQLDIDELLYLPRGDEREDARAYFGRVAEEVDICHFHNHEVMPCERLEVADWFGETLFKINPNMVADYEDSPGERERRQRRDRLAQGEDIDPAKLSSNPEHAAPNQVTGEIVN